MQVGTIWCHGKISRTDIYSVYYTPWKAWIWAFMDIFLTSFLCAILSTYLCASWTHCSGISFIIHYFFCQLCLIKMPLERLVWGWALPVLGRSLPVLGRSLISDQGVIGTISLRRSTPRQRWCSWSRGGNLALSRTHLRQCVTIYQYKYKCKYKYKHTCVWDSVHQWSICFYPIPGDV